MGRIIAITNQKGGVGKTTTAINLAATLAEAGKKVLLIDFDPQGNASSGYSININELEHSIYGAMLGEYSIEDCVMEDLIENLDIIPSDMNLAAAEVTFIDEENKNYILRKLIREFKNKYDYIIIDCPPSLGMLTVNALTAADTVIIPIQCEYYALEGLNQVLNSIEIVKSGLNPDIKLEGIVFTMFDARNRLSQDVVDTVKENFPWNIYKTKIPRNVRLAEAPSHGLPVISYASNSKGAESYRRLAEEIISKGDV